MNVQTLRTVLEPMGGNNEAIESARTEATRERGLAKLLDTLQG